MYLSNLKLWNFRKFGSKDCINFNSPNLSLDFTKGLNVIIGENDSGKSAIIDAIKLVLKTHSYDYIRIEHSDFYEDSNNFRIEVLFDGLSPDEAKNFTEWLGWKGEGQKATPYLKIFLDVRRQQERILPTDIKAGVDDDGYQLTAEAREYLKTTYLKPLRNAESDLIAKKNSRLSQILIGDSAFKGKEKDHELLGVFNDFNQKLKDYFSGKSDKDKSGKAIKDKIDKYIQKFYSQQYETEFKTADAEIKSILEKLTLILKNEPNPGLGTLNRLYMAAELLHLEKEDWSGVRLGLIEELEAHLHPQAQMQVIETFQGLDTIQLILTTHSPNLASKVKLENLIICENSQAFPMGPEYTKLDSKNYKFLEKFLDVTKANLFFAKGIILVEGWAEEIMIPSIARNIGIDLTEKGVSIINVGNLAYAEYANIFLRKEQPDMEIPVAVITDCDVKEYNKITKPDESPDYEKRDEAELKTERDKKISTLISKSEKKVKYFVAPKWTLEYSFLSSSSISEVFKDVLKSVHSGTSWENDFEKELAKKLINKGLTKTEIAYQMADAIDSDLEKLKNDDKYEALIAIDKNNKADTVNYIVKAIEHAAGN